MSGVELLAMSCNYTTALILSVNKAIAVCFIQRDVLKFKLALPQQHFLQSEVASRC
jgi:hypothetical protein